MFGQLLAHVLPRRKYPVTQDEHAYIVLLKHDLHGMVHSTADVRQNLAVTATGSIGHLDVKVVIGSTTHIQTRGRNAF